MTETLEKLSATEKREVLFEINLASGIFRTLKRGTGNEEGDIIESAYKIGNGEQTGSTIYRKASQGRYSELNKFLQERELKG